ncbi:magnesium-translocating P-type ATPase [Mycobacteroides franklinii]|nr:magnesium-translocating P-type ATPase [Mycobacteroides franklinii]
MISDGCERLRELSAAPLPTVFDQVCGSPRGLTEAEAADRLHRFGPNSQTPARDDGFMTGVRTCLRSPFLALLAGLCLVFVLVGDRKAAVTVAVMIALAVALRLWQRTRSMRAIRGVRELVTATATVRRRADEDAPSVARDIPVAALVPGDVVVLGPGDVVAADLRIASATDLVIDQSAMTGESLPVYKDATATQRRARGLVAVVDSVNLCLSGTTVVAGAATGIVVATGSRTYCGALARHAVDPRSESSFDHGVRAVSWTLIRFMLVLVPIVFAVNGLVSGAWGQAAMFAVAVAVGLTPEMLPVIVTSNLARGAVLLARERVVIRRLNAIQDLGAMDVLCIDKTGTLTEDRVVYAHSVDVTGHVDDTASELAYLAMHFQDGPHSRLDQAIAQWADEEQMPVIAEAAYTGVAEIAPEQSRRKQTVVVSRLHGEHMLLCKGDPDEVLPCCTRARVGDEVVGFHDELKSEARDLICAYRKRGMQVMAVAAKSRAAHSGRYHKTDENGLVLVGFVGFVDPVRDSASCAVTSLSQHGVRVKILTGDDGHVAQQVATQVGVTSDRVLRGKQIDKLADSRLQALAMRTAVFAELTPGHKARIVAALRDAGCAVGFLGDGVNDVAALRIADASIAPDTATGAAKQAADLILLDKDLAVIARAVIEGRRTLANTMKYIKITASSNFGNVLSVMAASMLLPFLPMLPSQLMMQNLLYDIAQLALPWDRVDPQYLRHPRRWQSTGMVPFMLIFGALSSVFDLATFAVLWWACGGSDSPSVFQTGWFIEGLLTQLAVVLALRSRALPWRGPRPAPVVVLGAVAVGVAGVLLPFGPLAEPLQMTAPPLGYLLWLVVVTSAYVAAAYAMKRWYQRWYLRRRVTNRCPRESCW